MNRNFDVCYIDITRYNQNFDQNEYNTRIDRNDFYCAYFLSYLRFIGYDDDLSSSECKEMELVRRKKEL